jgi:hypothetical protein
MLWRGIDEEIFFNTHISAPPPADKFTQPGNRIVAGRVRAEAPDQRVIVASKIKGVKSHTIERFTPNDWQTE